MKLEEKFDEKGRKISPHLPENVKNYLIDIDGTIHAAEDHALFISPNGEEDGTNPGSKWPQVENFAEAAGTPLTENDLVRMIVWHGESERVKFRLRR